MERVDTAQLKARIRREVLPKRLAMSGSECQAKSLVIQEKLLALPEFAAGKIVAFYMAIGKEVQTKEMILQSMAMAKRILIPKLYRSRTHFIWSEIRDIEREMCRGDFGILEPQERYVRAVPWKEIELVIVPGVAFDLKGRRIGFGKGYYDRMLTQLEKTCLRVGLAFEFQIVPEIPQLEHDIPVHKLITEKRVISCLLKQG